MIIMIIIKWKALEIDTDNIEEIFDNREIINNRKK